MYENQLKVGFAQNPSSCIENYQNLTVGENIERKIAELKQRLEELEKARDEMKTSGLYNMKISYIRDAMQF